MSEYSILKWWVVRHTVKRRKEDICTKIKTLERDFDPKKGPQSKSKGPGGRRSSMGRAGGPRGEFEA
jgi:hypothetical protein